MAAFRRRVVSRYLALTERCIDVVRSHPHWACAWACLAASRKAFMVNGFIK
jgi:hypothetical protein